MDGDAPTHPSAAARLTARIALADDAVNGLHDRLNDLAPRLWWPLAVPSPSRRLGPAEHALYGVHAGVGIAVARLLVPRALRRPATVVGVSVAAVSWAVFTGAWDRRADQAASAARRPT
ncbi:MAG: hypothetical protein ACR2JV_06425 [Gaiellales bacterium]